LYAWLLSENQVADVLFLCEPFAFEKEDKVGSKVFNENGGAVVNWRV
jgi:hypothetical protein